EPGKLLDFEPIEQEIYRLANNFSLVEVPYDSYQLAYMANRLRQNGVNAKEFNQQKPRLLADKNLQLSIVSRQMAHDGNPLLRQHIDNADIVKHGEDGIRIIKRAQSLKVDGVISLSMARERCAYYNF